MKVEPRAICVSPALSQGVSHSTQTISSMVATALSGCFIFSRKRRPFVGNRGELKCHVMVCGPESSTVCSPIIVVAELVRPLLSESSGSRRWRWPSIFAPVAAFKEKDRVCGLAGVKTRSKTLSPVIADPVT